MAKSLSHEQQTFPKEIPADYWADLVWWEYTRRKLRYQSVFWNVLRDSKGHNLVWPRDAGVFATHLLPEERAILIDLGYSSSVLVSPRVTADDFLALEKLPRFIYPDHLDGDPEAPIRLPELRASFRILPTLAAIRRSPDNDAMGLGYLNVGLRRDMTEAELRAALQDIYREVLGLVQRDKLGREAPDTRPEKPMRGILALSEVERAAGPIEHRRRIRHAPTRVRLMREIAAKAEAALFATQWLNGDKKARKVRFSDILKRCEQFDIWPRNHRGNYSEKADRKRSTEDYRTGRITEADIARMIQSGEEDTFPVAPEQ
ncbi:MAG: hypothetical protein O7H41_08410 [Planctomycetota bacterium]|nr:hypothetical protein [Planctomycetota bacterium]